MRVWGLFLTAAVTSVVCHSGEYFVSVTGDDARDGLSRETAFATVQRGVDALAAGDTLTILPGEYRGAVYREGLGSADAETLIRTEIPATVVIRGDEPVGEFQPVAGYRFVYAADFVTDGEVTVVNEWDTQSVLDGKPTVGLLEFIPGSFFYDQEVGRLYISTPDLQPPTNRSYSASIKYSARAGHGIELVNAQRVILDGLAVTGFNANQLYSWHSRSMGAVWGILLVNGSECVIRNCRVFMNSRGICVNSLAAESGDNVVEGCVAWANSGQYDNGDTGGLTLITGRRDVIRNSVAFNNGNYGINLYGGPTARPGVDEENKSFLLHNLAWGNDTADIKIKTGQTYVHRADANIGLGLWSLNDPQYCLMGRFTRECDATNIPLNQMEAFDLPTEFADPDNLDFRLQANSRFRAAGPDGVDQGPFPYEETVYYVAHDGDDSSDGLAVATAWRTPAHAVSRLKPGDTLYLLPGTYRNDWKIGTAGPEERPIHIRGRGREAVILNGRVTVETAENLIFERLIFAAPVEVGDSAAVSFHNCVFTGTGRLQATLTTDLRVTHCEFQSGGVTLHRSSVSMLSGNLFHQHNGAAVTLDSESVVRYSDYNGYGKPAAVWRRDGQLLSLAEVREGHDHYSTALHGDGFSAEPGLLLSAIRTGGPHGTPLGLYEPQCGEPVVLMAAGPFLHSVSTSTANFEWWVSGPTDVRVSWGVDGVAEPRERLDLLTSRSGGFSLTGLEAGSSYWLVIEFDEPVVVLQGSRAGEVVDQLLLPFTTAAAPVPAVTYYVAPDGDNSHDGLSRETAFQTVTHAAAKVGPGDTVMIAGGTYYESVYMRASGEADRPITFRSIPGEKVVFDGDERTLSFAFSASSKHHLRFDGFYFRMHAFGSPDMPWSDHMRGNNGVFIIYRSNDVQVRRCFHDGRGLGYSPGLIQAWDSADFLLENSVTIRTMGGAVSFSGCPNLKVRNNVFLRSLISLVSEAMNPPDMPFVMKHNIFTDNIPTKVHAALFSVGKIESMLEDGNCYFLRIPDEERKMFQFYGSMAYERAAASYRLPAEFSVAPVFEELTRMSLAAYRDYHNPTTTSIVADPKFVASLDIDPIDSEGKPVYVVDQLVRNDDLDFSDLFATNPEVIERGIGLQPQAFIDAD